MFFYLIRPNKGINAKAKYDVTTGTFIVLKGSRVCSEISSAPTFRGAKAIRKQRQLSVDENFLVTRDTEFKSSSTAGNFVTGRSTDGPSSWKSDDGRTFKTVLRDLKE